MRHFITHLLKPVAIGAALLLAPDLSAQMMVIRPAKVADHPKVAPVNIAQAPTQIKETKAKASSRKALTSRKVRRPKSTVSGTERSLPPLEFTPTEDSDNSTPRLNPAHFMAEKPESQGKKLETGTMHAIPVGAFTVSLPESVSIFESGSDFFTGALDNLLEIDSWQLDPTYKLSSPQAYIKYISELYGGIESRSSNGNRTEIAGYDTQSSRNYHVTMVTDGDKFYVARIIYKPAIEKQVTELIIPNLLVSSVTASTL